MQLLQHRVHAAGAGARAIRPTMTCMRLAAARRGLRHDAARVRASPPTNPQGSSSEFEGVPKGDEAVQAFLEDQLRLQLESEVIKEGIRDDLRQKVDEARRIGDELQARLDEGYAIERFRNDLESQEALASAMDKFSALEEEIAAVRQQLQADREEFAAWERAATQARNRGLFFKSLYVPESSDDVGAGGGGGGGGAKQAQAGAARWSGELRGSLDPEAAAAARRAAERITAPAVREVGSGVRAWLFAYMAAVLAIVVAQDLSTPAPSLGLDGLYAALGLVLGVTAVQERHALLPLPPPPPPPGDAKDGGAGGGGDEQRP